MTDKVIDISQYLKAKGDSWDEMMEYRHPTSQMSTAIQMKVDRVIQIAIHQSEHRNPEQSDFVYQLCLLMKGLFQGLHLTADVWSTLTVFFDPEEQLPVLKLMILDRDIFTSEEHSASDSVIAAIAIGTMGVESEKFYWGSLANCQMTEYSDVVGKGLSGKALSSIVNNLKTMVVNNEGSMVIDRKALGYFQFDDDVILYVAIETVDDRLQSMS